MRFLLSAAFWFVVILTLTACSGGSKEAPVVVSQLGGAIQGKGLPLSGTVTTIAGPVPGAADGIGAGARFECPVGMASDGTNIFITDPVNHTIRRMVISTGEVTTLAGTPGLTGTTDGIGAAARFNSPTGIATDSTNLYVLDSNNCTIRKISIITGLVQTIAGSAGNRGATDGTGAAARFARLQAITTDGTSLFVADGNTIRRVDLATGAVTTLAGSPTMYTMNTATTAVPAGNGDGTGTSAFFRDIRGITTDGSNLFVSDNNTIRQVVIASAVVTTLAGDNGGSNYYGPLDGTGTAARFGYAAGITNDGTNLYILDSNMVRKVVIATAKVTTVGNTSWQADSESSMVMTTSAYYPAGVTAVGGALFIGDSTNRVIRRITIATGVGETVAGFPGLGSADGTGAKALFNYPGGITTDGPNLYVADRGNCTIRKIELATGTVSTLAGSAGKMGLVDGTGSDARFRNLQGITTDGSALYVTDGYTIRKVDAASGKVTTLFNWSVDHPTAYTGGTMNNVPYYSDITTDGTSLFIADRTTISKIVIATGELSALAGSDLSGWADGFGGGATFGGIGGLTTDGTSLYVADSSNSLIRKVIIATGEVTTLAGRPNAWSSTDGYGSDATFANPIGMTTDGTSLYITENSGCAIRKLVLATGEVTTLAGANTNRIARDGVATAAGFAAPAGITTDGRSLFVTDGIGMIRRVD